MGWQSKSRFYVTIYLQSLALQFNYILPRLVRGCEEQEEQDAGICVCGP